MGEDTFKGDLFFINEETGETGKIGKISEVEAPKIAPGGIIEGKVEFADIGESKEFSISVKMKVITKKRAIKLMMGWGFQRNEAYEIHKLYMKVHKARTLLELRLFCMMFG